MSVFTDTTFFGSMFMQPSGNLSEAWFELISGISITYSGYCEHGCIQDQNCLMNMAESKVS